MQLLTQILEKGICRGDQSLQIVNKDIRPLTLMDRLKGKSEDIENLDEITSYILECGLDVESACKELNMTDEYIPIPEEVQDFYKMVRPSPLTRAYFLEKVLAVFKHLC